MCGIVGIFNFSELGLTLDDIKVFKQLLIVDSLRGSDGTGIFYVGDENSRLCKKGQPPSLGWMKSYGNPYNIINEDKPFKKRWEEINLSRFIVGHNRYATQGVVSTKTAHPFSEGNITLVHNGTVARIDGFNSFKQYEVDSQAICAALSQTDKPEDILESIDGAAALIWWNSKDHTINIWRNYQRPLFYIKQGNRIYFASEDKMLRWIMDRNNIGGFVESFAVPAEQLFTWSVNSIEPAIKEVKRRYLKPNNLPVYNAPIQQPAQNQPNKVEPKVTNSVQIASYNGLNKNVKVVIEPTNTEDIGEQGMKLITGKILRTTQENAEWNPAWENITVVSYVKPKAYNNIDEIIKAEYLEGQIQSMTMNTKDVNDVKLYVNCLRPVTLEQALGTTITVV